jgi:hypothetical protein
VTNNRQSVSPTHCRCPACPLELQTRCAYLARKHPKGICSSICSCTRPCMPFSCHAYPCVHNFTLVYYESIKREPKIRGIKKCRCDERLETKTKEFTRLPYTCLQRTDSPENVFSSKKRRKKKGDGCSQKTRNVRQAGKRKWKEALR